MSTPWLILSRRYGGDVRNPTGHELREALVELYVEALPGMTEADYEEHGSAFLRLGEDEGPMYVVYVTRTGRVTFEQWADQDFMVELAEPSVLPSASLEQALSIWSALSAGQIQKLQSVFAASPAG